MSETAHSLTIEEIRKQLAFRSRIHSFFDSALILALVELSIFSELEEQPRDLRDLSRRTGVEEKDLSRILRPACASNLLKRDDRGAYSIPDQLRGLVEEKSPVSVIPWVRFLGSLAPHLFSLPEVVRTKERKRLGHDDYCLYGADFDSFTEAMHGYALTLGAELVDYLDLLGARSLLDLACGSATYALLLAQRFPKLSITLMDSEKVLEVALRTAQRMQLANRVQLHSGDVLQDPLPGKFDCVLISNTLHLIGPEAAQRLIKRAFDALNPGGKLVIQGQLLSGSPCDHSWPAMLDLVLLCGSPRGENHSAEQAEEWLRRGGFVEIQHKAMSLFNANSLVTGKKPE